MNNAARTLGRGMLRSWQLYVLLVPALAYLFLFRYVPMYGAQIAFKDFNIAKGIIDSPWAGLKHFDRFFHAYDFWRIIKNTLFLSVYHLAASFPIPILLALSLNYVRNMRFKKTVQMVTYAPYFISLVVLVSIIMQFLAPRTGPINNLLTFTGMSEINFMGKPELFSSIYVWSDVWQNAGFACIIYLAALSGVDPAWHESAVIDGASIARRVWHIDLPTLMPIAIILLILNIGNMFDLGFEKVLLMQNPLNLRSSEIIDTYVYKLGLTAQLPNYSYAAAIGLFKNIVAFILIVGVNQTARKLGRTSLW
ncbi:ABC transporter permease [Cohnella cellulosilytica]|uniref:ABC transporter permease n=1 Tax=Cohnella cellulosilytica TaxID=986710 RepID=A0ABW2FET5_9BACL